MGSLLFEFSGMGTGPKDILYTLEIIQNADLLTYFLIKHLGFDFFFFLSDQCLTVRKQSLRLLYLLCKLWKEEVGWKIAEETCQIRGRGFSVVIQSKIPTLPRALYQCLLLFLSFHVSFPYHGIFILILVSHFCSDKILMLSLLRSLETTQLHKYFLVLFCIFFLHILQNLWQNNITIKMSGAFKTELKTWISVCS